MRRTAPRSTRDRGPRPPAATPRRWPIHSPSSGARDARDGAGAVVGRDAELVFTGQHRMCRDFPIAIEDVHRVAPPLDFDPLTNEALHRLLTASVAAAGSQFLIQNPRRVIDLRGAVTHKVGMSRQKRLRHRRRLRQLPSHSSFVRGWGEFNDHTWGLLDDR